MLLHAVLLSATALLTLCTVLYCLLRHQMSYWRRRDIAHSPPDLLYGNLRGVMAQQHFADIFRAHYERFKGSGPFAGFYMLCNAAALVLDVRLAKRILITDFHNFSERGFFYNERDDPLTAHIFSLPSAEWRQLRAKLSPAFTAGKLALMLPSMCAVGARMVALVDAQIAASARGECILELKDLCDRFTTDIIGACIFGLQCNSLQDPSTEFRTMNQNLFDNPRNHRAIDGLLYAFPRLARFLRLKQIPNTTSEFYFRIVRETMAYRTSQDVRCNDLLQMLLDLKECGKLSLDEIVANAFLFFFAGFETSATTMTMALYELARAPKYQELARKEIVENGKQYDDVICDAYLKSLSYLDQVINETLRKHTIIPQLQRKTLNHYQTDDAKFYLSKGTLVLIPIHAIHHDPALYPQPESFRPERFSTANVKTRQPTAWLPFGEGPRNCIGMSMARMQMRLGLVTLLRHYRFTATTATPTTLEYYMQCPFLVPKSGIFLGVEKL